MSEGGDVVIIGAGGGGYPAAFLLAAAGRRVVLVDPIGNLGGDCLAEGCVPSKAVRESALALAQARAAARFGLRIGDCTVNWPGVLAHKDSVQRTRYAQHAEELGRSRVRLLQGAARIVGERMVEVDSGQQGRQRLSFEHLILATGSAPQRLPIAGADLAITSHDLFRLGADLPFPSRPVIVGGGYIGVECASMLEHLGARPVVLEYTAQLLPGFDADLAAFLHRSLAARVRVELNAEVTGIEAVAGGLTVRFLQAGQLCEVAGDAVIMATGRRPVLPEGLEHLGLPATGALGVDAGLRSENPVVWAPGDVNGRSMLFHSAVRQSLVVAHNILAGGQVADRMDFGSVPFTVFTEPELASVGLTEAAARERYGAVEVATYDYAVDARAQILGETAGFIKLVCEPQTARLLGAQIAGVDAAQLVAPLALALAQGLGARALAEVTFPHPMISEGINKAARQVLV